VYRKPKTQFSFFPAVLCEASHMVDEFGRTIAKLQTLYSTKVKGLEEQINIMGEKEKELLQKNKQLAKECAEYKELYLKAQQQLERYHANYMKIREKVKRGATTKGKTTDTEEGPDNKRRKLTDGGFVSSPTTTNTPTDDQYSVVNISQDSDLDGEEKQLSPIKQVGPPIEIDDEEAKPKSRVGFKYQEEPIRKRKERELLKGRECEECAKFYDAIGDGQFQFDREHFVNECSRHRQIHTPPQTPPHYWDVDFPSTQKSG